MLCLSNSGTALAWEKDSFIPSKLPFGLAVSGLQLTNGYEGYKITQKNVFTKQVKIALCDFVEWYEYT